CSAASSSAAPACSRASTNCAAGDACQSRRPRDLLHANDKRKKSREDGMAGLTRSYVHGASDVPLIGQTLGEYFDAAVARFPDADALVARQQKVRLTYRQLQQRVDAFAAGLLALGLEPGDRVGIWSPNNAEWLITQFATAKAGLILVNINPSYRLAELEYALNKVGCKADHGDRPQDQRLHRHAEPAGTGAGDEQAGRAQGREAAGAAHPRADRRQVAGHVRLR